MFVGSYVVSFYLESFELPHCTGNLSNVSTLTKSPLQSMLSIGNEVNACSQVAFASSIRPIANPVERNSLSVVNYRPNPFSTFSDAQPKDTPDRQSVEV